MEDFGDRGEVAGKVALGPLGNTSAAPRDEDILGKPSVGVLDLHICELYSALVEILDQLGELALWRAKTTVSILFRLWNAARVGG